jgi:hypothetical protein
MLDDADWWNRGAGCNLVGEQLVAKERGDILR